MGYTHYWTSKDFTQKQWDKFKFVCDKLLNNLPKKTNIAGGSSSDLPLIINRNSKDEFEFSNKCICFNGDTPHQLKLNHYDLSHETFLIENVNDGGINDWSFCKTARKPYDLLVCACLIAAHKYLGFEIKSDGDLSDWKPAFDYYAETMEIKRVVRSKRRFLNEK